MKSIYYFLSIVLMASSIGLMSCRHSDHNELAHNHEREHVQEENEEGAAHAHSDDEIVLEPEMAERFGVNTKLMELSPISGSIRVTGQLVSSPSDDAVISAGTSGVLTLSPTMTLGAKISKGQTVGRIQAKSSTGDDPNVISRASITSTKRELERLKPLLDDGIITLAEYNPALSAYEAAKASFSHASASGNVVAPAAGVVTELLAVSGQFVETGTPLARISGNTHLVLRADVPERDIPSISSGIKDVLIRTSTSGDNWLSIMSRGGKRLDRQDMPVASGYKPLYFLFTNDDRNLTAGGFVDIDIMTGEPENKLVVPVSALVEQQGENYIYIKVGPHTYRKQLVKVGGYSADNVVIVSGLSEGMEVVTSGASVVKMAESSGTVPEGHSHNH